jgi:DNA-binding GntR family transcriptional regulator
MASELSDQRPAPELSKAERVYDYLRGRIREGKIPPGTRLSKNEVALACGVSRAPVSEAIARLASEGLVDVFPQSGSFVAPIREEDIHEALFMRYALEVEAARQITRQADEELLARLEDNLRQQEAVLKSEPLDPVLLDDLDEAFHVIIMSAIHSPRARRVLNAARAMLDRPRFLALPEHDRPYRTLVEHRRIYDAICTGDPGFAGSAMRVHIAAVEAAIEEILEQIREREDD